MREVTDDMVESIAAASINYSQAQTQQAVSISLMKDAMDTQSEAAAELLRSLEAALTGLGQNIDVMA